MRNQEGVLISFEGIDAAGKNTQSRMLFDYFRRSGTDCEYISFPDYATPLGQEIKSFLERRKEYNLEARHLLYAANRYEHKERIENWIAQGKLVVINRYAESNLAYGGANGIPLEWLMQLESRMPKSDYVFYLRLSPEISAGRKRNRDRYEADLAYLRRVSEVYDALIEPGRWFSVEADRPRDLVHYEIVKTLSALNIEKSNIKGNSAASKETSS